MRRKRGAEEPFSDEPHDKAFKAPADHGPRGARYPLLLDAHIPPEVARVGRSLGLDVVSVYECGRGERRDDEHLRLAAAGGRIFVTRNRNDFLRWTVEFARIAAPHAGVLIVPRAVPATRPEPLARALVRWVEVNGRKLGGMPPTPYFIDFVSAVPVGNADDVRE